MAGSQRDKKGNYHYPERGKWVRYPLVAWHHEVSFLTI